MLPLVRSFRLTGRPSFVKNAVWLSIGKRLSIQFNLLVPQLNPEEPALTDLNHLFTRPENDLLRGVRNLDSVNLNPALTD
jgi:hypothetical protein